MQIKKRNGSLEDYDVDKIHKVLEWATDGINGVSFSEIAMNARKRHSIFPTKVGFWN